MPAPAYLAGVAASAVTNVVLQLAIVIVAGHVVFGVSWPQDWASLLVFAVAGVICFASLGVALSHAIPNSESAPAYVNAVFLPMLMIAGVFYDEEDAPAVIRDIAEVLPLKHLVDGLSGAMVHGEGIAEHGGALAVLGLWTAVGRAAGDPRLLVGGAQGLSRAQRPASSTKVFPPRHDTGARRAMPMPTRESRVERRIARCGGLFSHDRTIAAGPALLPQP